MKNKSDPKALQNKYNHNKNSKKAQKSWLTFTENLLTPGFLLNIVSILVPQFSNTTMGEIRKKKELGGIMCCWRLHNWNPSQVFSSIGPLCAIGIGSLLRILFLEGKESVFCY